MNYYRPTDTYHAQFFVTAMDITTGVDVTTDSDNMPNCSVFINGTIYGALFTVTRYGVGHYLVDGSFASAPAAGDRVTIVVDWTIGSQAGGQVLDEILIVSEYPAAAGDQMDLIDAPNSTAIAAIQSGLSIFDAGTDTVYADVIKLNGSTYYTPSIDSNGYITVGANNDKTGYTLDASYDAAKTAAQPGDKMDIIDAPNSTAIAAIQNGVALVSSLPNNLNMVVIDGNGNITGSIGGVNGDITGSIGGNVNGGVLGSVGGVNGGLGDIANIEAVITAATDPLAEMLGYIPTTPAPTVGEIADAVWDESVADHQEEGSTGEAVGGSGGSAPTVEQIDAQLSATHGEGSWEQGEGGSGDAPTVEEIADGVWNANQRTLTSSGDVTITSPVSPDGETITIVRGDDYSGDDSRAIAFSASDWADLTGAAVVLSARSDADGSVDLEAIEGEIENAGESTQTVTFALSSASTGALDLGEPAYWFDVQATLPGDDEYGGRKITLVVGRINVIEDVTP